MDDIWKKHLNKEYTHLASHDLEDFILHSCVPMHWFDLWESAECEILRIVNDELTKKIFAKT